MNRKLWLFVFKKEAEIDAYLVFARADVGKSKEEAKQEASQYIQNDLDEGKYMIASTLEVEGDTDELYMINPYFG